jgi:hypothetical protein
MPTGKEEVRQQLEASVKQGNELLQELMGRKSMFEFGTQYQNCACPLG